MPRLVFIGSHFAGRAVELGTGRTMVGRGHWNGLVIPDKTVSAYHCDLLVHGTEVIVREKASTNGTWVDEKRVTGQLPVKPGQIVHFGSACAQLMFDGSERWLDESDPETGYHEHLRFKRAQQAASSQVVTPRAKTMPDMDETIPTCHRLSLPPTVGLPPARAETEPARFGVVQRAGLASIPTRGWVAFVLGGIGAWLTRGAGMHRP